MEAIIVNGALGAVSGFFIAGAGYFQASQSNQNWQQTEFDPVKFGKTIVLGALVGGIAGASGMAPAALTALPVYAGVEVFVERIVKAIWRKISWW